MSFRRLASRQTGTPRRSRWSSGAVAVAIAAALLPSVASADRILSADSPPISGITVERIADGELVYTSAMGARITKPVHQIGGLVVSAFERVKEAEDAAFDGEPGRAHEILEAELGRDRPDWLKRWIRYRLMHLAAQAGRPLEAVKRYASLVRRDVHPNFLRNPPVEAIGKAEAETRKKIRAVLEGISAEIPEEGPVAKAFRELERYAAERGEGQRAPGESAIPMSAGLGDDEITALLKRGAFERALERTEKALSGPTGGRMAQLLYQNGLAHLGLAEKQGSERHFKSAGLSFMRAVIYFPRSLYAGPCLLEAGRVHAAIGRPEKAVELYDRALNQLDEKRNKHLVKRLRKLKRQATAELQ